ncbi:Kunitz trypsin inhibitor 5 [Citrus sinensis]|uniref:Kunitz trypsin inhibitor 5 n=1 Tax=Citrus sinensis TaxID=2711 RepID=A0ACB8JKX4_CITSI|nr:Kunitz trypsin inhibitor 5 [Citrus sinensis]
MKTSLVAKLSFLILALATKAQLGTSESEPILDVYGNKVESNLEYKLLEVKNGTSGGFSIHGGTNGECPLDVVQLSSPTERDHYVRLLPFDNSTVVRESTDLNLIEPVWTVGNYNASLGKWFLTTGGIVGHPGAKTLLNWFKLKKVSVSIYNLVHCPSVCDSCVKLCNKVGIFYVDGVRRLVLVRDDDQPLRLVLFPAPNPSRSSM